MANLFVLPTDMVAQISPGVRGHNGADKQQPAGKRHCEMCVGMR
jgi:hypothetical protein